MPAPRVLSVNVGTPEEVQWHGRTVRSAIWKHPVDGPIALAGVNLAGDDQADRRVHGGDDKAVYAYAIEDYHWWASALHEDMDPATFGENLTTEGLDLTRASIGDRWQVGSATLEVAQPRSPCYKLGIKMGDDAFPELFEAAARPGVYLRIVNPGSLAAGDAIEVQPAVTPAITLEDLIRPDPDRDLLSRIAADARVPVGWRRHAARTLERLDQSSVA
ncbi:MAG: MOSC domain-containing protein [Acidimicrobiales bacterium]